MIVLIHKKQLKNSKT